MAGPPAGRIVANRYALKTPLGRGGMGVVWDAYDLVLGREVAVKEVVLPPTLPDAERRSAQARALREARAAAQLDHPGAVTIYDVVQDRGSTFIVMELVRAPTLADLVRTHGPLPPEQVAAIGVQVAGTLTAAHRAGIVHRDVTPGNVMVREGGTVKLADFGIASIQGDPRLTSSGLVIGSPSYMAPEQAKGEPTSPATDFWGLGATMYYAVEGEAPFDRGSSVATLTAVVNEEPRPMQRAGPLAPLLTALLAKSPAARPPATALWLVGRLMAPAQAAAGPGAAKVAAPPLPAGPTQQPRNAPVLGPMPAPGRERPGAGVPAQGRSRPAIPPVPAVRRRGGGPLLGVLALLLVGGLLVAWLATSTETGRAKGRASPAPTTRGAATTATTASPAPTTQAPATTARPTTTREPTTTTTAAPQHGLPAGWRAFANRAGNYRVGVPPRFQTRTRTTYHATVVEDRDDPGRAFTVRSTTPANPLPQASRDYRAWARRNVSAFRELRYAEGQTYAGRDGAVVFEYEAVRDGRRVHVSHINFKGRVWGYNVEFVTPADQWKASKGLADQFEQAFSPLG